jgi:tetratricopeptide (TPR) repeat protein
VWLARSRFADAARLAGLTLTPGGDARALYQLGWAKDATGDRATALEYYGQALPIRREVGDRAGEAVTRYNVAMIHRAQGDLGRAVAKLEQVVELDRQVSHPDRQSDSEMLHRLRQELANSERGRSLRSSE